MNTTENTDWAQKKAAAKRVMARDYNASIRRSYDAISGEKEVLDIARQSPPDYEMEAEYLAGKLESLVRRRVERMPTHEIELLDSVITLLRSISGDRARFIDRLADGYERQLSYWEGHARNRGMWMRMVNGGDITDFLINKILELDEHKG